MQLLLHTVVASALAFRIEPARSRALLIALIVRQKSSFSWAIIAYTNEMTRPGVM